MSWFDKNDRTSSSHFDGVQLSSRAPSLSASFPLPSGNKMRAPVRLNRREVRPGQAARGRWGSRAVAPRLGRPSRRRGRAGQAEGPRGRDDRRGAGAWRGGWRGGGEASSDARWTLGGAVEARPARVELGGAGGASRRARSSGKTGKRGARRSWRWRQREPRAAALGGPWAEGDGGAATRAR